MTIKHLSTMASVAVLLSVSACSSTGNKVDSDAAMLEQLEARQAELSAREAELKKREQALTGKQNYTAIASGGELLPPNAEPGMCFTRVWEPPKYKSVSERKLVSEAGERIEIIPAKYGTTTKKVLVQEASTKLVSVPATYRTVTEKVMVKSSRTVTDTVPPVYETVSERVIDKPAHTIWKKGEGPIQRIDASTGEIMCLVEVPATYKTISKRVLKTPATTRTRTIPAEYKTVTKRVVDKPAHTKEIQIPAKYATVSVTDEIKPAQERRVTIPAKYTEVTRRELVEDGHMQWREIMCETNTTPEKIRQIQTALQRAGYNPGSIDGQIGPGTIRAVTDYQRAKGLPVDGNLTVKTINSLGISL